MKISASDPVRQVVNIQKLDVMIQIPGYHILEKIGEGGMAVVYKGIQLSLKRLVAVKVLQNKLADHPSVLERFKRESLIIARLNHPHIIHIIDRGVTPEGMPYFIMEYVEGTDLGKAMEGVPDSNRKLDILVQILKALSYAHKNGVIHRDIKPSNVRLDQEGHVRVLDFGIAQFYDAEDPEFQQTTTGTVMGTLDYMSPEQKGQPGSVTAMSDLYSLGVVMYELFTGKRPQGRFQLPSEINPLIPAGVQDIIMSCLETDPADRPNSADDIKNQLLKVLSGAHLKTDQKKRAGRDLSGIKEKFSLLDVIKEERHASVHLYEDRINSKLMVIKKRPGRSSGFLEAKLLSMLRHENIVDILGTSRNRNAFIVVMEYLSGGSLKDRMVKPSRLKEFLSLAEEISAGLAFAHRNGILHGNLRPSNILFSHDGSAKVVDFGLDEHYVPPRGKTNWYNPAGEARSIQADILAAGVIFLQVLTGTDPEWVDDTLSLPQDFDDLPIELQGILIRMFSNDKGSRYKSFMEVHADIAAFMAAEKTSRTKKREETIIDEPAAAVPVPIRTERPSALRHLLWLVLLMMLLFAALFYLTYTGDIYFYLNRLTGLWADLAKGAGALFNRPGRTSIPIPMIFFSDGQPDTFS